MNWLDKGPALDELVSEKLDRRKGRSNVAIVMPTYQNYQLIQNHVKELSKQDFRDFDIIIVYEEEDRFIPTPGWASIIHVRRKGRNGAAGGFYVGEKIALEEGYQDIILADDDCLPKSKDLIKNLVEAEGDVKIPKALYFNEEISGIEIINHYGCIKRNVLERAGLTFIPFYLGGDDIEFLGRIKNHGYGITRVNSCVAHPSVPTIINAPPKVYRYIRGGFQALILTKDYRNALSSAFMHLAKGFGYWFLGSEVGKAHFFGIIDGSRMMFSAPKFNGKKMPSLPKKPEVDVVITKRLEDEKSTPANRKKLTFFSNVIKHIKVIKGVAVNFFRYFRKRVYFSNEKSMNVVIMIIAKSSYLRYHNHEYELTKDRGVVSNIAGLPLLIVVGPMMIALAIFCLIFGIIKGRKIKTKEYGINKRGG